MGVRRVGDWSRVLLIDLCSSALGPGSRRPLYQICITDVFLYSWLQVSWGVMMARGCWPGPRTTALIS